MEQRLFAAVGGMPYFEDLVERFYDRVETDEVLRPLYPGADLGAARRRLALFLAQYWGGPTIYSRERGHPRLRARHFEFPIGPEARDRWLRHMRAAVEASPADAEARIRLIEYFELAAPALQNLSEDADERAEPGAAP